MQKINIYTIPQHDNFVWNLHQDLINLIEVETIKELWRLDNCTIIISVPQDILCGSYARFREINSEVKENITYFLDKNKNNKIILLDIFEAGHGVYDFLNIYGLMRYALEKKLLFINSGENAPGIEVAVQDICIGFIANRDNVNCSLQNFKNIYAKKNKPYTFILLNGHARPHRVALLQLLGKNKVLDDALWSLHDLDYDQNKIIDRYKVDFSTNYVRLNKLPNGYDNIPSVTSNIKGDLYSIEKVFGPVELMQFNMVNTEKQYIDSYFSVVAEQWHYWDYPFPSEKILRPILMGHPFIAVSSPNFYKKLKNMGFKTFDSLIDESFDPLMDHAERLKRSAESITALARLSKSNLDSFLSASKEICEHNRENLLALYGTRYIDNYNNMHNFILRNFINVKTI